MAFDAIGLFSPTTMNDCGEEEVNPYYVDLLNYAVYQGFSALSDKNIPALAFVRWRSMES